MKIVSFCNLKGGCGKSLASVTVASFLAKKKKKVLLIDADPQANATANCGFDTSNMDFDSLGDIFEKSILPSFVIVKSPIEELPTLDLIPSNISLTATEMRIVSKAARETILKKYIEKYKEIFEKYDYIICDLSPNINVINQNCLYMSDSIILVCDVSINAFNGAILLKNTWQEICESLNIENKIKGLIVNRFDQRVRLSKDFIEYLRTNEDLDGLPFDTIIPENVKLKEAEVIGKPICIYDTKCAGYMAFSELMKELKGREVI